MEKRFLPRHSLPSTDRERLLAAIAGRLMDKPDILFAYVHGSFVNEAAFRDIDVGIFTSGPKGFTYESDLSFELSRMLGYDIEIKVVNEAPVAFQMAVVRDGRLLFTRDQEVLADFIEDVGRRYREYAHFRNVFMEAAGAER